MLACGFPNRHTQPWPGWVRAAVLVLSLLGSVSAEAQEGTPSSALDSWLPSVADDLTNPKPSTIESVLGVGDAGSLLRPRSLEAGEPPSPTFRLRGRIDSDFLWADQDAANRDAFGPLEDEFGLRRARIGGEGSLTRDSRYVAEIDLASGDVVLRDGFIAFGGTDIAGEYKIGHMREPFSLEGGTSGNSFAFMERSPVNVLDPARNWGVGLVRTSETDMWTFSAGIFAAGTDPSDTEYGPGSTTGFTARWTGLAWNENQGRRLMHFGLAISERVPNDGVISVKVQPRSPLLDFGDSSTSPFISSLTIPADFQQLVNLQWAYVHESFWTQAEWYGSGIVQTHGNPVFLNGSYIDAGYFLTGEHRKYQSSAGVFGAVEVNRPLLPRFSSNPSSTERGFGALEATARLSYLDFVDSDIPVAPLAPSAGVRIPLATVGLNWYLADRLRLMFNYTYATPDEINSGSSSLSVFGMRLGMFW